MDALSNDAKHKGICSAAKTGMKEGTGKSGASRIRFPEQQFQGPNALGLRADIGKAGTVPDGTGDSPEFPPVQH